MLDGLFHRGVVVCEAESDARLYNAALDARLERRGESASRAAVAAMETSAPTVDSVREQLLETLGNDGTARLTEEQTRRIREITTIRDGWRAVRERGGVAALPRGDSDVAQPTSQSAVAQNADERGPVVTVPNAISRERPADRRAEDAH